jgi:hypothetical protein
LRTGALKKWRFLLKKQIKLTQKMNHNFGFQEKTPIFTPNVGETSGKS